MVVKVQYRHNLCEKSLNRWIFMMKTKLVRLEIVYFDFLNIVVSCGVLEKMDRLACRLTFAKFPG